MKLIENKEQVIQKLKEKISDPRFRTACIFCGGSYSNYRVSENLMEIDGQLFVQFYCGKCGHSILLNYKVLMDL